MILSMRHSLRVLFSLLVSTAVMAGEAPQARLDAMSRGFRTLDYYGVFTYEQGQTLSSHRIAHKVVGGVEQERVVHLDGDMREFHRAGHTSDCEHAGDRLLRLDPVRRLARDAGTGFAEGIGAYYAIENEGPERVASRMGQRLRIMPRDPYRYGMIMVLDDESALLLKSETVDGIGRVLERFQFVELHVGEAGSDADVGAARIEEAHLDEPASAEAPIFDWTVSWLPRGFVRSAEVRHQPPTPMAAGPVEIRTYTDGLAVFSIFVENTVRDPSGPGVASRGATVSYVVPRGRGHLVTVVGEIPVQTAQLIANAVNFPDEN